MSHSVTEGAVGNPTPLFDSGIQDRAPLFPSPLRILGRLTTIVFLTGR